MNQHPLISIIIPAFNAERFLAQAITSILDQNAAPIEIVVVDDGSADRTAAIAAKFAPSVRCISQPNRGAPAARNSGLAVAAGDLIGFCDADDCFLPGALQLQLEKLALHPEIDLVVGRSRNEAMVSEPDEPVSFAPAETSDNYVLELGVSLMRRHVFETVGSFDEALRQCDDWDWFMRARELKVPMLFHANTLMQRRLHDGNITRNQEASRRYTALMLKRSIDRRRRANGQAQSLATLASQAEQAKGPDESS